MNVIREVAKILDVELYEEFCLKDKEGKIIKDYNGKNVKYRFTNSDLQYRANNFFVSGV